MDHYYTEIEREREIYLALQRTSAPGISDDC